MSAGKVPLRNADGYVDPTAYEAMNAVLAKQRAETAETDERVNLLIKTLKNVIRLSGFELAARIEVRDIKSGRVYR